jgi:hypothetical protein
MQMVNLRMNRTSYCISTLAFSFFELVQTQKALKNVTTLMSLTQVAMKGKGLRARRENKQVGKA